MKLRVIFIAIFFSLIFLSRCHAQPEHFPVLSGLYFGQKPPGITSDRSAPGSVTNANPQKNIDNRLIGLETLITTVLHAWNVPGCALAIVENEEVLFTGGFGFRELRQKELVDEHTVFPIASCTKAFTAALIGILEDEGKLDIDKPANSYLPILTFSDPLLTMLVTPRDMMTHRTGIPRHDNSWYGSEQAPRDSLIRLIQYFPKSAGLREKFQYNNYMYTALGAMAECVEGGKTWEEQILERFFIPLEMNRSTSVEGQGDEENRAYPHEVSFAMEPIEVPFVHSQNMGPCGSIHSDAEDMAKWLITWINGGTYKNKIIIPKRFYSQAIATQWGSPSGPSKKIQYLGYGFGWNIAIYQGHYSVFHGGGGNGFSSLVLFLPSDNLGIAIFANARTSAVPMILANFLCDRLLNLPSTDWSTSQLADYKDQLKRSEEQFFSKGPSEFPPSHGWDAYCGRYSNPGYGQITIIKKGDSLSGHYGSLKVWLKHQNHDAFSAILYPSEKVLGKVDVLNRPAVFRQNSHGEISELTILLERAVDPIVFKKEIQ